MLRTFALAAALAAASVPASARAQGGGPWDDVAHAPGNPVVAGGSLVLHDDGAALQAFSAVGRRWTAVAPTGTPVVAAGDRVALLGDAGGRLAWSALRGTTAALPGGTALLAEARGDVAVVVVDAGGTLEAHAYSAVTGTADVVALGVATLPAFDVAVGDGVVMVRDDALYHGFGARTGAWSTFSDTGGVRGDVPVAGGGEVAMASLFDSTTGLGERRYVAYSGAVGAWDVSDVFHFSNAPVVERQVAFVRTETPILTRWRGAGFSAATGAWVTSGTQHTVTGVVQRAAGSLVLLEDPTTGLRFEAFGARPGTWSLLGGGWSLVELGAETAVVADASTGEVAATSALAAGWDVRGGVPAAASAGEGAAHLGLVDGGASGLLAVSAASGAWTDPLPAGGGATRLVGDAAAAVVDGGALSGWSARWSRWTAGPALGGVGATAAAGSVVAVQDAADHRVHVYDEALDRWDADLAPGGPATLSAGRSVLLAVPDADPGALVARAVRTGAWSAPDAAPLATPLALGPEVEDEVVWLVDGAGRLHAFGGGAEALVVHGWPHGDGFHVFDAGFPVAPLARVALAGEPSAETAFLFLSPSPAAAPLALPGIPGLVCLELASASAVATLPIGASGVAVLEVPTGAPGASGVQLWLQSALLHASGTARVGDGCDAAWFF